MACLASLEQATYQNLQIIVLDNNSSDNSIQAINKRYPQVKVIELQKNLGLCRQ